MAGGVSLGAIFARLGIDTEQFQGGLGKAEARLSFPWARAHGLIEAASRAARTPRVDTFPWARAHGLIEARGCRGRPSP